MLATVDLRRNDGTGSSTAWNKSYKDRAST